MGAKRGGRGRHISFSVWIKEVIAGVQGERDYQNQ